MDNELMERVARVICASVGIESFDDMLEFHKEMYRHQARAVLAELAGELRDGTCEWWEDGEMWESSCGVAYTFIDTDGPADNGHTFCHKCGKRIAIDEARGSMIVR